VNRADCVRVAPHREVYRQGEQPPRRLGGTLRCCPDSATSEEGKSGQDQSTARRGIGAAPANADEINNNYSERSAPRARSPAVAEGLVEMMSCRPHPWFFVRSFTREFNIEPARRYTRVFKRAFITAARS